MLHVLTVVLVILKALGYITFAWIWCFLPSIIVIMFAVILMIVGVIAVKMGG